MKRLFVIASCILFVGAVSGCGGGGSSSSTGSSSTGSSSNGGSNGTVTHPYMITTAGSILTFSDGSTDKVTANANGSFTVEEVSPGVTTYKDVNTVVVNGTAIDVNSDIIYKNSVYQNTTTFSPAWRVFPSSTTTGFSESQTVTESHAVGSPTSNTSTLTVIGTETVTVTAGTFQNVIKIRRKDSHDDIYEWFAPGVGAIKIADAVTNNVLRQLVSYTTN